MNTVPNLDEFFSLIFPYLAKILSLIISLTDHIVGVVLQRIESRDINLANRNVNTSFAFVSSLGARTLDLNLELCSHSVFKVPKQ